MSSIKIKIIIILCLFLAISLSGCQEENKPQKNAIADNVELDSNLVELVRAEFIEHIENTVILKIEVKYLLKNIAGKILNINISAEFYDKDNNLLYKSIPMEFLGMAAGYEETEYGPTNSLIYDGENAKDVDHVKIIVEEIT